MSTTIPSYTGNTAGNIDNDGSLAASATRNKNWDISPKFEGQVTVLNTPGGAIHATTRGVRVDVYRRYGATPETAPSPFLTFTLPSAAISTAESLNFWLGPGIYNIKITNLDVTNAVTVQITGDTVDNLTTT